MATETVSRSDVDPGNFMAGVALMDDLLTDGKRLADERSDGAYINASERRGQPLNLFARPFLKTLVNQPALLDGFAAALGDIVSGLQVGVVTNPGAAFGDLSFGDVFGAAADGQSPDSPRDSAAAPKSAEELLDACKAVLHGIAAQAQTIRTLAHDAMDSEGDSQQSHLWGLAALAERIGYTSDRAIGFQVQEPEDWLLGPGALAAFATLEARHEA